MLRWFKSLFSSNNLEDNIRLLDSQLLEAVQKNDYKLASTLQKKITKLYDEYEITSKI